MSRVFALGLFLSFSINAALPPLSEEQRQEQASAIVDALVTGLIKVEVEYDDGFVKDFYNVQMKVQSVEKGPMKEGQTIYVSFWKLKERPTGWAGPSGQSDVVKNESRVRAYLVPDGDDWKLLEPNGFDQL